MRYKWSRRISALIFFGVLVYVAQISGHWLYGSIASLRWFDVLLLSDPLATLETSIASGVWRAEIWLGTALLSFVWLLLPRTYCGWLCPLGLLCDVNESVQRQVSWRLNKVKVRYSTSLFILGGVLLVSACSETAFFQSVSPINALVLAAAYGIPSLFVLPAVAVSIDWLSPRIFCRRICPLGTMHNIIGRLGLTLKANEISNRPNCANCSLNCKKQETPWWCG